MDKETLIDLRNLYKKDLELFSKNTNPDFLVAGEHSGYLTMSETYISIIKSHINNIIEDIDKDLKELL